MAGGADAEPGIEVAAYTQQLQAAGASFVTLTLGGRLRGCIGSLEARAPLVADVAHNAWRSAYKDPRFAPVTADEIGGVTVSISVLGTPEPLAAASEAELVAAARPGVDGLILADHGRRGTFLPQVWETIPDAGEFVRRLKQKAGLPADHW